MSERSVCIKDMALYKCIYPLSSAVLRDNLLTALLYSLRYVNDE